MFSAALAATPVEIRQYCEWTTCYPPQAEPKVIECTQAKGLLTPLQMGDQFIVLEAISVHYACWPIPQALELDKISPKDLK